MQLVSKFTQAGDDVKLKASDSLSESVLDQPQDCQEEDLSTQSLSADSGMVIKGGHHEHAWQKQEVCLKQEVCGVWFGDITKGLYAAD